MLNSKSVLVEFPDDYKKVREGDKNVDQEFDAEDTSMKVSMYYSNLHYVEMLHED